MHFENNLLITGGTGRLGKACKKIMPQAQYPSRIEMNVLDERSIENYFNKNKISHIIHLAAMSSIRFCEENKKDAYEMNVNGVRRVLDAAKKHGTKHFIYLSTACVFSGKDTTPYFEDDTPDPKHYYGLTKLVAEEIAKSYSSDLMKVTVVRTNFTSMPWEYPSAFTDRYGTYLFAQGVAKGLKDILIECPNYPIIHVAGDKRLSMYEYALLGKSNVRPMTLSDYSGPELTKDMSLGTKVWKLSSILESSFLDE